MYYYRRIAQVKIAGGDSLWTRIQDAFEGFCVRFKNALAKEIDWEVEGQVGGAMNQMKQFLEFSHPETGQFISVHLSIGADLKVVGIAALRPGKKEYSPLKRVDIEFDSFSSMDVAAREVGEQIKKMLS
jgi:hypothetical protein